MAPAKTVVALARSAKAPANGNVNPIKLMLTVRGPARGMVDPTTLWLVHTRTSGAKIN